MSYAKSLKLSPFKTLTLTLGKLPDGSIWQNAFITQEGAETSLSVDCPAHATRVERKDFLPLVKEALRRAQSIEELTGLLKPPAPLVELILPGVVDAGLNLDYRAGERWTTAEQQRWTTAEQQGWTAEQEMAAHEPSLAVKLLCILTNSDHRGDQGDPTAAIEAVLNSGLLPEPLLRQWLNRMVERAIRRVERAIRRMLGHTSIWEGELWVARWKLWAARWMENADRSEEAAQEASDVAQEASVVAQHQGGVSELPLYMRGASWAALDVARGSTLDAVKAAMYVAYQCSPDGETGIYMKRAGDDERKAQYDDLRKLINEL